MNNGGDFVRCIICLDEKNGMMFNKRRLSQDIVIVKDVLEYESPIMMNSYSYKIFAQEDINKQILVQEGLPILNEDYFQWIEDVDLKDYEIKISELIVYYWNRMYPSDLKCHIDFSDDKWEVISEIELNGNSHEKITKRVYKRKEM